MNCAVNVKSQRQGEDVIYTVSGEGAAKLHRLCGDYECKPSELTDGSFTVTKSGISSVFNSDKTPILDTINRGLEDAANRYTTAAR